MSNEFKTPGWLKVGFAVQTIVICVCLYLFAQSARRGELVSQATTEAQIMESHSDAVPTVEMSDRAATGPFKPFRPEERDDVRSHIDDPHGSATLEPMGKNPAALDVDLKEPFPAIAAVEVQGEPVPTLGDAHLLPEPRRRVSEQILPDVDENAIRPSVASDQTTAMDRPPELEVAPLPTRQFYGVSIGSPSEVAATIRELFADSAKVSADSASRSVIVIAQEATHRQVAELIDEINERAMMIDRERQRFEQLHLEEQKKEEAEQRENAAASGGAIGKLTANDDPGLNNSGNAVEKAGNASGGIPSQTSIANSAILSEALENDATSIQLNKEIERIEEQIQNARKRLAPKLAELHIKKLNYESQLEEAKKKLAERTKRVRRLLDEKSVGFDFTQRLEEELLSHQQELAQMKRLLGPQHPKVVAAQESIKSTRDLLADYRNGRWKVWQLKLAPEQDPDRVTKLLSELFGDQLRLSVDEVGNTITIRMSAPKSTSEAQALFDEVSRVTKSVGVTTTDSIATNRFSSDEADSVMDREAKELALRLRNADPSEREALLGQLRRLTQKQFQQRQDRRKLEFDSLAQRVDRLKDSYRRRQEHQSEIIERRINDLLDPNADLRWDSTESDGNRSTQGPQPNSAQSSKPTVQPLSQNDEAQYDGQTYRQWLRILENETKAARLADAVLAMGHLLNSAEPRELSRTILQMVRRLDEIRSSDPTHYYSIVTESFNLFARLPPQVVVERLIEEIPQIANHTSTRDFFDRYLELIAYPKGRYGSPSFGGFGGATQIKKLTLEMMPQLQAQVAAQSHRMVTAFVGAADRGRDPQIKLGVMANAARILTISKQPLQAYPDLVPLTDEMFQFEDSSPVGDRGLWQFPAAILLAQNNFRTNDALQFAEKFTSDNPEPSTSQFAHAVQVYVAAVSHDVSVIDRLEKLLESRWKRILASDGPSVEVFTRERDQAFCLVRALADIGGPAMRTVKLLDAINDSAAAEVHDRSMYGGEMLEQFRTPAPTLGVRAQCAAYKIRQAAGTTNTTAQTQNVTPKGADKPVEIETTYDGITYSQWLKLLETERKPEKLTAAIETCARLVVRGDERRVVHLIFLAEGLFEGEGWSERPKAADVGWNALTELPYGDVVIDELLVALRDRDTYQKGRMFQIGYFLRPEPLGIPKKEMVRERANEVVTALLDLVPNDSNEADFGFIAAAINVCRQSERPLTDFDRLPEQVQRMLNEGVTDTKSTANYYWLNAMTNLATGFPETPNLARGLLKQARRHAPSSGQIVSLIGAMKQHAAPIVPELVDLFESECMRITPNPRSIRDPGPIQGRGSYVAESPEFLLIEIIMALGQIGTGDAGFELLNLLKDLGGEPATGRGRGGRGGPYSGNFADSVATNAKAALAKFPNDYTPTSKPRLFSDFWKLNGAWQLTSASHQIPLDGRVNIRLRDFILSSTKTLADRESQFPPNYPSNWLNIMGVRSSRFNASIDPSTSPKQITLRSTIPRAIYDAMDSKPKGEPEIVHNTFGDTVTISSEGIYELKDETLIIQLSKYGQPRPEQITGDSDVEVPNDQFRLEFQRIATSK